MPPDISTCWFGCFYIQARGSDIAAPIVEEIMDSVHLQQNVFLHRMESVQLTLGTLVTEQREGMLEIQASVSQKWLL